MAQSLLMMQQQQRRGCSPFSDRNLYPHKTLHSNLKPLCSTNLGLPTCTSLPVESFCQNAVSVITRSHWIKDQSSWPLLQWTTDQSVFCVFSARKRKAYHTESIFSCTLPSADTPVHLNKHLEQAATTLLLLSAPTNEIPVRRSQAHGTVLLDGFYWGKRSLHLTSPC